MNFKHLKYSKYHYSKELELTKINHLMKTSNYIFTFVVCTICR